MMRLPRPPHGPPWGTVGQGATFWQGCRNIMWGAVLVTTRCGHSLTRLKPLSATRAESLSTQTHLPLADAGTILRLPVFNGLLAVSGWDCRCRATSLRVLSKVENRRISRPFATFHNSPPVAPVRSPSGPHRRQKIGRSEPYDFHPIRRKNTLRSAAFISRSSRFVAWS